MTDLTLPIRKAEAADVAQMVALSGLKRREYAGYEPVFWREAENSDAVQTPFFLAEVANPLKIALVWDDGTEIKGFAIAGIVPAPPVYAPGGLTCIVDDFAVRAGDWETIARPLLAAIGAEARARGAVQMVVVCGHLDQPKRSMLAGIGCSLASEWYVLGLT